MLEPTARQYRSSRLTLNYVDWGNEGAPVLILIHGRMDHCRSWDWVARRLAHRYRVIAPDLRGHGDSDWAIGNAYAMYDYIYDLMGLIEQLKSASVSIIGHSLGGGIATKFAGVCPERVNQLVSIEGLGSAPAMVAKEETMSTADHMLTLARQLERLAVKPLREFATEEAATARMKQANSHLSDERARHLALHGIRNNKDGNFCWKYDPYVGVHPPFDISAKDSRELWSNIVCPVLLVWGQESWASNPLEDGRIKFFQNAQVVSIPSAGHWVHHDQFEEFMAAVETFLE